MIQTLFFTYVFSSFPFSALTSVEFLRKKTAYSLVAWCTKNSGTPAIKAKKIGPKIASAFVPILYESRLSRLVRELHPHYV
jgi:hypothetical protein